MDSACVRVYSWRPEVNTGHLPQLPFILLYLLFYLSIFVHEQHVHGYVVHTHTHTNNLCACMYVCHGMSMVVRGELVGVDSLLPPRGSQGGGKSLHHLAILPDSPFYFLRWVLSLALELANWARLAGQRAQGSPCLCPSRTTLPFFCVKIGTQIHIFVFVPKTSLQSHKWHFNDYPQKNLKMFWLKCLTCSPPTAISNTIFWISEQSAVEKVYKHLLNIISRGWDYLLLLIFLCTFISFSFSFFKI